MRWGRARNKCQLKSVFKVKWERRKVVAENVQIGNTIIGADQT